MSDQLSAKQQGILDFLRDFIEDKDYPPSIRDIQQGCDISSTSVVDYNLKRLEERGFIRRDREVSRAIELLEAGGRRARTVRVPVLGKIAAGSPIPTPPEAMPLDQYDDFIEVTEGQTGGGGANIFALRVEGESMIDALINDGDVVIFEPVRTFNDGDMVAVWLKDENETTLKKVYREGDRVRLQPMNKQMEPFYTPAENIEVHGRVLTAIREW
ncbi:MAG TPA: transcriptional repressor LexA [Dehalococcoidia bacterium]|nr:transcriptional repressor LexA [Dehalococcoidia bacterium]